MIVSDRVSPGPANVTCDRQRLFPVLIISLTYVLVLLRSNTLSFIAFPTSISGSSLGLAPFAFTPLGLRLGYISEWPYKVFRGTGRSFLPYV
jgi:hypothetical protein